MEKQGIVFRIGEWSEGKLSSEELLQRFEDSKPDLLEHREGFQQVVSDLNEAQREHCADLISFCFDMIDQMEEALAQATEGVEKDDRNRVFIAGDTIARSSFQLNQAFQEFRNQALLALGPTDIPNLNLLLQRRDDYLDDPSDNHTLLFREAIDAERIVVYHAIEALEKEPDLSEVRALLNAFRDHMTALNDLFESLESEVEAAEYEPLFAELEKSFSELQELVPAVQMKLRTLGETDYPDLNLLLNLMEDVAQGNISDGPLLDALEAVDESFSASKEKLAEAEGTLDSALGNDEISAVLETYEEFDNGMEALYRFLDERDRAWLVEAKGCLLEFAKRFSDHQKKFQEIEANQGRILCPMCSTYNDVSRNRCSKCGAALPQNVAAATVSTFQSKEKSELEAKRPEPFVTANTERLYLAVNEVAAGSMDPQTFLSEIERFENIIEVNAAQIPAEPELAEGQEELDKVYDAFEQGVETLRSGLALMKTYVDNQDEETLATAVKAVDEGARLVGAARDAVK